MKLEAPPAAWVEDSELLAQACPRHHDGKLQVGVVGVTTAIAYPFSKPSSSR